MMQREHCHRTTSISLLSESLRFFSVALSLLGLSILPVQSEETAYDLFTPPGELIDIGTHRLHIHCKGTGSPTIIIDSGLGSFSLEWKNIQDTLSNHVTTCIYDRAGYGWSEVGPLPRTTNQIANELQLLIDGKQLQAPFILVGHSFGGYNMRYFASKYQDTVAGLVLIDSSHPEQFDRMDLKPFVVKKPKYPNSVRFTISRPVMHANYPEEVKNLAYAMLTRQKSQLTRMNELENFELSAQQVANADPFPDVPLVVVSRGKRVWPENERGDKMEAAWEEMQSELSYLSDISIQVIANKSGHSIHLDQPLLASSAILNAVGAARQVEKERLAQLSPAFEPENDNEKTTLFNYFQIPMIGGLINPGIKTIYHDATVVTANLN